MKRIAILGSTGSIGTQALDVIRQHPDCFETHTLTAGHNAELLIRQAKEFKPDTVVIADESRYDTVREALSDLPVKVYAGSEAIGQVVQNEAVDMVLTAMVGFAGLIPTIKAIEAGKALALANKETLVVAGSIIRELCARHRVPILPVDSEHSAIFQCLNGEHSNKVKRILLTASGGPFRTFDTDQLRKVTASDALRHPNWKMGDKITIDSATLMNKGFEMIEARWLYDVEPRSIEVVVHPESVIHSAVEFEDRAIIAQLGVPDMRLPIQYAFSYPKRLPLNEERLDLMQLGTLHFERPDTDRFPCLRLAFESIERGGNVPCALNAANEIANRAFRDGKISFADIPSIAEKVMHDTQFTPSPTLDDLLETDKECRQQAEKLILKQTANTSI